MIFSVTLHECNDLFKGNSYCFLRKLLSISKNVFHFLKASQVPLHVKNSFNRDLIYSDTLQGRSQRSKKGGHHGKSGVYKSCAAEIFRTRLDTARVIKVEEKDEEKEEEEEEEEDI